LIFPSLSRQIDLFGELLGGEFSRAAFEHDASIAQDIDVIGYEFILQKMEVIDG